jgi:hypothetical protein
LHRTHLLPPPNLGLGFPEDEDGATTRRSGDNGEGDGDLDSSAFDPHFSQKFPDTLQRHLVQNLLRLLDIL